LSWQQARDKTAVDATLAKGATISGKVALPAGVNAFNVSVSLFKAADGASVGSVQLNSDGTYALRGVPAGSYKLRFDGYGSTGLLARWYTNATSLATATPVMVADGQTLTAINATLVKGGVISGKITAPGGDAADRVTGRRHQDRNHRRLIRLRLRQSGRHV
jgi:hypothetical protein